MSRKICVLGGGGARTPLLIHGLAGAQAVLQIRELALFDLDKRRLCTMADLGRAIAGSKFEITTPENIESAIEGSEIVISSIRVGGMSARARDERIVMEHGYVGQETTGAGGLAMALRTIPVALEHAHLIERLSPDAWLINFTNPAGLITQALVAYSTVRVIGICDTPSELFHRIAWSLAEPFEEMEFSYFGLNHLGWVRRVLLRGEDVMGRLLQDDGALLRLYPGRLFEPALIRNLHLIPTEYLFFYYSQKRAYNNQRTAGASRGEEILKLNEKLFETLNASAEPVEAYKQYLNARNASYMRLEAHAESALNQAPHDWNPFEGATGYHRIALEVITALIGNSGNRIVINVQNQGAIPDLIDTDVVEVPAVVDRNGAHPLASGTLPFSVRGLVEAVKEYERRAIAAAVHRSLEQARLALMVNPIVGDWDSAVQILNELVRSDPQHLGYLR